MAAMGLVERDEVMDDLRAQLEAATGEAGRIVLLAGSAGIGKTSVARELADLAPAHVRVLCGACDALATPRPLGPLVDMVSALPTVDLGRDRHHVFTAVLDELATTRSLVVIEDVHWADDATLDLLVHLGRRIDRTRSLLVATYRGEEVGTGHALAHVLGVLATAPGQHRRHLEPLSRDGVAQLVGDREVDVDRLYRITGGNPFHATEVLATPGWVVPPTVADAVRSRANRLADGTRDVLDTVAVEPGPVALADLAALGHAPGDVDAAVTGGMLVSDAAGLRFRHELARLAIAEGLAPAAAQTRHRRWLDVLSDGGSRDAARLAHHAKGAHDDQQALRWSRKAAAAAMSAGAHHEAVAHLEDAVARCERLDAAERANVVAALAGELSVVDRSDESIAQWRRVIELRREVGDRPGLVEARAQLATSLELWDGPASRRMMASVLEAADELPPGRAPGLAYAFPACRALASGDVDQAIALATHALELARPGGHDDVVVDALNTLGSAMIMAGDMAGIGPLEESRDIAAVHGWDRWVVSGLAHLGVALGETRIYDRAVDSLRQAIEFAAERDLDGFLHYATAWLAQVHFEQGRWDEAVALVADLPDEGMTPVTASMALTVQGRVVTRRGDAATDCLDEAWRLAELTGDLPRLWPVAAGRAEAAWLGGEVTDELVVEVAGVMDQATELGMVWAIGELAFWLDRLGVEVDIDDWGVAGPAEPYELALTGQHAAAATAWRELGCPYEHAWALADRDDEVSLRTALAKLAELGAKPLADRVRRRLRELGAIGVPAGPRAATAEHPGGLTARQADVLALVAAGHNNREIAARLFISPKTVGHHVSAVLARLGVDSRTAATALAHQQGWLAG